MRRLLIILLLLLVIFVLFFYFSLGKQPEYINDDRQPAPSPVSHLDSVVKDYADYEYLKGFGYVQSNRRAVLLVGDDADGSRQADVINSMEAELESYWKWQILTGNKNFEEINPNEDRANEGYTKKGSRGFEQGKKNIFSRIIDVFKVSNAVSVIKDSTKNCDCDEDFLLLKGPDLHRVDVTLNPDGPIIATGKDSDFPSIDAFKTRFMKQSPKEPQVGYGKSEAVSIGIIDSGINFKKVKGQNADSAIDYNFLNHTSDVVDNSDSTFQHGTYISRVIAHSSNPNSVKCVGLKTFDEKGVGNLYDNLCAIMYSIKHNIKIVNTSWGLPVNSPVFEAVLERAKNAKLIIVCSAGNYSVDIDKNPWYPACYANNPIFSNTVVSVTSKYGKEVCMNTSSSETKIDLSVETDDSCMHPLPDSNDNMRFKGKGTSFAAPYALAEVVKYMSTHPVFLKPSFIISLPTTGMVKKFKK